MFSSGKYVLVSCALIKCFGATTIHKGDDRVTHCDYYCMVIFLVCNNRDRQYIAKIFHIAHH